jgi:hypothetical protein
MADHEEEKGIELQLDNYQEHQKIKCVMNSPYNSSSSGSIAFEGGNADIKETP